MGGQAFILDKIGKPNQTQNEQNQTQFQNYYRFLNFLREESRKVNRKKRTYNHSITEVSEVGEESAIIGQSGGVASSQPTTSAQAMFNRDEEYISEPTVVALPKLNMIITFSNVNDDIERIEPMSNGNGDEECDEEEEFPEQQLNNNEISTQQSQQTVPKDSQCNQNDDIPFIDNEKNF